MSIFSKSELAAAVAEQTGRDTSDVVEVVESVFNNIAAKLGEGQTVVLRGIGSFSLHEHKPRKRYNFKTEQMEEQPGFLKVEFEAAKAFEEVVEDYSQEKNNVK